MRYVAVALGAMLGANLRFIVGNWAADRWGVDFPYGTLIINVTGSLFLGWFMIKIGGKMSTPLQLAIGTGFVGAYTTFSTYMYESDSMLRNGDSIRITGLDDVHAFYTSQARAALEAEAEGFRIALVHSPEVADHAAAAGYAFYLCGHTHGGQVCVPGLGAIILPAGGKSYVEGLYRVGASQVYTSRGIGMVGLPFRFNCPPEVTEITLAQGVPGGSKRNTC